MNLKTVEFQEKAIERFYKKTVEFLQKEKKTEPYTIVFQSPTGSGKTVMMSKILEKVALENENKVSLIWLSKGILAEQSKKSFEKYIGGGGMSFSFFEDIMDNEIKENEVLFINWEKLHTRARTDDLANGIKEGDWTNVRMRENEKDRNLKTFCQNAVEKERKIVLVVDESHLNVTQNTLQIVNEVIKPHVRIDVTATPKNLQYDFGGRDGENISFEEVRKEEMIKKEVVINADVDKKDIEKSEKTGDEIVFEKAVEKRDELLKLYKKEGSGIKPLVLIQLPNDRDALSSTDKEKIEWIEKFLDEKYEVNYNNKKLAKWTSKDKINLEKIVEYNSDVEFLIFKQAIATGWDCPRAQILIKFRNTTSETFEIQTVGRILRSPEFKWYENENLNRAYVYANLTEIQIAEKDFEYIKTEYSKRKKEYENIDLVSVSQTKGDQNTVQWDFRRIFYKTFLKKISGVDDLEKAGENFKKFKNYKNESGESLNFNLKDFKESLIANEVIENVDKNVDIQADGGIKTRIESEELERIFYMFLDSLASGWNKTKTINTFKNSLYTFFDKYLEFGIQLPVYNSIDKANKDDVKKVVLLNKSFFEKVFSDSISLYSENRSKKNKEFEENSKWNIPEEESYTKNATKCGYKKTVMQRCFVSFDSEVEKNFIENYLEKKDSVEWWYKNGVKNKTFFGIKYKVEKSFNVFYPDFIVKYSDGKIGIFDTKQGRTAKGEDTVLKANALSKYIKSENKKGKKLFGGIVVPKKDGKSFKLNRNKNEDYVDDETGEWDFEF